MLSNESKCLFLYEGVIIKKEYIDELKKNTNIVYLSIVGDSKYDDTGNNIIKCIKDMFKSNKTIKKLDVISCKINSSNIKYICKILKLVSLTHLQLDHNNLHNCKTFFNSLHNVQNLKSLSVKNCKLEIMDLKYLCDALKTNKTITTLFINSNVFDRGESCGSIHVGDMLEHNTTLKKLVMLNNSISGLGVQYISNGLLWNSTLTSLIFVDCLNEDTYLICNFFKNQSLTLLNIEYHIFTKYDIKHMAKLLKKNTSLKELLLHVEDIDGMVYILNALKTNNVMESLYIQYSGDNRDIKLSIAIANCLKHNKRLNSINIDYVFDRDDLKIIKNAVKSNGSITKIQLDHNHSDLYFDNYDPINDPITDKIGEYCRRNEHNKKHKNMYLQTLVKLPKN